MAAYARAQRRVLHVVFAEDEFQVIVVALGHGELVALENMRGLLVQNARVKKAVVNVFAGAVVQVLGILFSFKESYRVLHQEKAEAQGEYLYKEVRDRRL